VTANAIAEVTDGQSAQPSESPDAPDVQGAPTGHPRVDAALQAMAAGTQLSTPEQVAVYESVHQALQETLRTIEEG
jgi:hypothetical protein